MKRYYDVFCGIEAGLGIAINLTVEVTGNSSYYSLGRKLKSRDMGSKLIPFIKW